jgi:predicted RNase H-like nuclease (RuvC/YqgF family)
VDNLTEVLINLYEEGEKPKFPTDYIKANLKSSKAGENEVNIQNNKIREENKKLKQRVAELERTIEKMKKESN